MELFDDFYDASTSRLHNHRPIVHDRVPVARPHMIFAGYRVKRNASLGQHGADAHLVAIREGGVVLAYDVFAKPRPLLDAQNAAHRTGRGAYGPSYDGPDRACCSVACGSALLGSSEGSLCVCSER